MTIKLDLPKLTDLRPRISVIGVGGAGGNAINNMIASGLTGVDFIAANTDAQALAMSSAERRLQLGVNLTEGLGAGARPDVGQKAAEETVEEIRAELSGSHMVFVAAGMGGGTGTGAAPVVAKIARELGALTVAIVTKPFHFEGTKRMRAAEAGIEQLRGYVDTLIVIPNQNLFRIANERTTFAEAFVLADQVLHGGIACVVDLIMKDGLINLDFADVRAVMSDMGTAVMGTGEAEGNQRAVVAAEDALANPLLDSVSLADAQGVLISIVGGPGMTLYEVDEAANRIRQEVDPDANIIVGATFDAELGERLKVSLVAAGMDRNRRRIEPPPGFKPASAVAGADASSGHPLVPPPLPAGAQQVEHPAIRDPRELTAQRHEIVGAREEDFVRALGEGSGMAYERDRESSHWQSQNGVTIEPEPARAPLQYAGQPIVAAGPVHTHGATNFAPAPAHEARPDAPRFPTVDEFPAVGQKAYHAMTGDPAQSVTSQTRSRPRGLFDRLTGRGAAAESPRTAAIDVDPASVHASAAKNAQKS